jgi:hypothetical protein
MTGSRPVIEEMTQVPITLAAKNLYPIQTQTVVRPGADIFCCNRSGKTRPAGVRIELILRPENRISAANTTVKPALVIVPIQVMERKLGGGLASDRKSFRAKLLQPFAGGFG